MPKRKRKTSKSIPLSKSQKSKIIVILLVLLDILIVLSFMGLAGTFGEWFDEVLFKVFGWTEYLLPVFMTSTILFVWNSDYRKKFMELVSIGEGETSDAKEAVSVFYGGLFLLFTSLIILLGLLGGESAGGTIGNFMATFLNDTFSIWGGLVLDLTLFLISLVLLFNISFKEIGSFLYKFFFTDSTEEAEEQSDVADQQELAEHEEDEISNTSFLDRIKGLFQKDRPNIEIIENEDDPANSSEGLLPFEPETDGNSENDDPLEAGASPRRKKKWQIPPTELLDGRRENPRAGDIENRVQIIRDTFSDFGIVVDMGEVKVGPTVSQFALRPNKGTKLNKITSLHNDLALALAAHPIRIEAPIPGRSEVGIEVPNERQARVRIREIIESNLFKKNESPLTVALGKDVSGATAVANLEEMPHLLVAGATGSGKSIFINDIILSLLYQNSPDDLKLILVDPKRVELIRYNGLPHLLSPVIVDPKKTITALKWAISEMERRYKVLSDNKKRDIESYNKVNQKDKMSYIVIMVDELADLMMTSAKEVEGLIVRLAQMARAVGIHLIIATQRPSVEVLTGIIKANITTRIAFKVASQIDSRTIIDSPGAEKLVGRGDMLFITSAISSPKRIQSPFNSEKDVNKVVKFIKKQSTDYISDDNMTGQEIDVEPEADIFKQVEANESQAESEDDKFVEARNIIVESRRASTTYLQRRLKIGYSRAARLMDILEEEGVVGPAHGSKPREVLVDQSRGGREVDYGKSSEENQAKRDKWSI